MVRAGTPDALSCIELERSPHMILHLPLVVWMIAGIAVAVLFAMMFGVVVIGPQESGLVVRRYGRPLPPGRMIATRNEAGYQASMLPPGWHFPVWSWKYTVK